MLFEKARANSLTIKRKKIDPQNDDTYMYNFGVLGGVNVYHLQGGAMGTLEPNSTPFLVSKVFPYLNPTHVIVSGIAFGREGKGQKLGEILTCTQLFNYESRKVINGTSHARGGKVPCELLEAVNAADTQWNGTKVHKGLVVSGNVLIADQEFLKFITSTATENCGGDMESYGVCSAAKTMSKHVSCGMIKGISDWAKGDKNDNHHKPALENLYDYIFHLIAKKNLKRKLSRCEKFNKELWEEI